MTPVLTALKEKGNAAFVRGDYEGAVHCYSEGLEKLKDMKVLYTNRAQVSASGTPQPGESEKRETVVPAACGLWSGRQGS